MRLAKKYDIPILDVAFLSACINHGYIVDTKDYLLERTSADFKLDAGKIIGKVHYIAHR